MLLKKFIDLTDGVISRFTCIAENSRLDINITIGIICRLTIFTLIILFKDIKQYSIGEVIAWIIAGLVQHLYILLIEKKYMLLGLCTTLDREIQYKIMDSLQLLIGIIFLILNLRSYIEIIALVLFSINFVLDLFFIIVKIKINQGYANDYVKEGGAYQFCIGFLFGAVAIIIVVFYFVQYLDKNNPTDTYGTIWNLSVIGQSIVIVVSFSAFCSNKSEFKWSNDWAKGTLQLFNGIQVGVFSIIYGLLLGTIIMIWFWWDFHNKRKCCYQDKDKRRQESEQVATV
ncbi:unnamed protein product [Paramecium octaurelia]|uniref:Uncharacterized protein n=1 Tax=Paramecium octaurelia TaxID=43137 RepID=A0A8S1TMW6_PAROT|nr:unnamed protein product [Paramecium octaurelia]